MCIHSFDVNLQRVVYSVLKRTDDTQGTVFFQEGQSKRSCISVLLQATSAGQMAINICTADCEVRTCQL